MFVLLASLASLASAAWACTEAPAEGHLVYPPKAGLAFADTVVIVDVTRVPDFEPELLDPTGAPVPVEIVAHAGVRYGSEARFKVLFPAAPLVLGPHVVVTDDHGTDTFFVGEDGAVPVDPPVPTERHLYSELLYHYGSCGGYEDPVSELRVHLCGDGPIQVVAEGPTAPADPSLATPGDGWLAVDVDHVDLARVLGVYAGWTGTLWYGSFDAAGRFSGWTGPDPVEMPEAPYGRVERMPGADDDACPPFGPWELEGAYHCPTPYDLPDCELLPEPADDTGAPMAPADTAAPLDTGIDGVDGSGGDDDAPRGGCGCAASGAAGGSVVPLFLAVLGLRRRGARRAHTSQRSSR